MTFINNSIKVKKALDKKGIAWLEEVCVAIHGQTVDNTKRKSSQTAGSWQYAVDESKMEGYVGSNNENAIWEEFGTGEYALNNDGRKGGWWIKVGNGKNEIPPSVAASYRWVKVKKDKEGNLQYVFTYGKKPRRALFKAYTSLKKWMIHRAEELFGGLDWDE